MAFALPVILPPDFGRAVTQLPPRLGQEISHIAFAQGNPFPVLLAQFRVAADKRENLFRQLLTTLATNKPLYLVVPLGAGPSRRPTEFRRLDRRLRFLIIFLVIVIVPIVPVLRELRVGVGEFSPAWIGRVGRRNRCSLRQRFKVSGHGRHGVLAVVANRTGAVRFDSVVPLLAGIQPYGNDIAIAALHGGEQPIICGDCQVLHAPLVLVRPPPRNASAPRPSIQIIPSQGRPAGCFIRLFFFTRILIGPFHRVRS